MTKIFSNIQIPKKKVTSVDEELISKWLKEKVINREQAKRMLAVVK